MIDLCACFLHAVSVTELEPVFTIDSLTGLVTIDATGPHLVVNGTSGILTVSVHTLQTSVMKKEMIEGREGGCKS